MKSIVQEASSLSKAIEQAWEKAGKPVDFSVRVLEEPQHNFFGFTTRSAKIALVFDEDASRTDRADASHRSGGRRERQYQSSGQSGAHRPAREPRPERSKERESGADARHTQDRSEGQKSGADNRAIERTDRRGRQGQQRHQPSQSPQDSQSVGQAASESRDREREVRKSQWSEAMTDFAKKWAQETLSLLNMPDVATSIEVQNTLLKITLHGSLVFEQEKERRMLQNMSALLFETLRRRFKTGLRGHRVIITH